MTATTTQPYCTTIEVTDGVRLDLFSPTAFRFRVSVLEGEAFPERYEIPFALGRIEPWPAVEHTVERNKSNVSVDTGPLVIHAHKRGEFVVDRKDGKRLYPIDRPTYGMIRENSIHFDSASPWGEQTVSSRYAHWFYNRETDRYDIHLAEDAILDRFFMHGETRKDLFRQFNEVVGAEPMLPRKAFGYQQTQHLLLHGNQARTLSTAARK